jgi:hypothetical protein
MPIAVIMLELVSSTFTGGHAFSMRACLACNRSPWWWVRAQDADYIAGILVANFAHRESMSCARAAAAGSWRGCCKNPAGRA